MTTTLTAAAKRKVQDLRKRFLRLNETEQLAFLKSIYGDDSGEKVSKIRFKALLAALSNLQDQCALDRERMRNMEVQRYWRDRKGEEATLMTVQRTDELRATGLSWPEVAKVIDREFPEREDGGPTLGETKKAYFVRFGDALRVLHRNHIKTLAKDMELLRRKKRPGQSSPSAPA